ncbi:MULTISPECIES: putative entry exclusion protein TrbK-alt [unclassified Aureimonas]|uniref:putative entry exclusion protein TrbK-alt n=1 Tax=unclassified Aureimonas TaxID=2615206 RepID=UPI0006FC2F26|nr:MULTISPECIES: putative entry exclusion protein TrbK-alt [unclassified Aureimonas]KQT61210.1 hypothetical protein ASG54_24000 [Aureimonas sp. Leaf460]KQT68659.1 hypothetical protein ASG62_18755 [Aureimonas sp. Leaf427]
MLQSRLQRTALAASGAILAIAAALTLGRTPERTAPVEAPLQATDFDDLSRSLRRCAALEGNRIEEAGCMAVWEENRRRFFGGQARPQAPVAAPVLSPAPSHPAAPSEAAAGASTRPPVARTEESAR